MMMTRDVGMEAEVYRILSRMYGPPEIAQLRGEFLASLRGAMALLGLERADEALEDLESYLTQSEDASELAREYVRLFRGPVRALAHPYGSMYLDGEVMGPSTQAVVGRYREAGLAVSEGFKDLPDHISTELEFMYYLASMEQGSIGEGDDAGSQRFRELRRSFLKEHLAGWTPAFADRVIANTVSPFYRGLATLTREFVAWQASPS